MIVLVVLVHTAVTYSSIGGWYYYEPKELDVISFVVFAVFQSFTQAYFMGFLFLISGYFVPAAYDKKGFKKFIWDRIVRLGVPVLVYMLIINPFIGLFLIDWYAADGTSVFLLEQYTSYIKSLSFLGGSGPLWFALALLIFSIAYGLIRKTWPACKHEEVEKVLGIRKFWGLCFL